MAFPFILAQDLPFDITCLCMPIYSDTRYRVSLLELPTLMVGASNYAGRLPRLACQR